MEVGRGLETEVLGTRLTLLTNVPELFSLLLCLEGQDRGSNEANFVFFYRYYYDNRNLQIWQHLLTSSLRGIHLRYNVTILSQNGRGPQALPTIPHSCRSRSLMPSPSRVWYLSLEQAEILASNLCAMTAREFLQISTCVCRRQPIAIALDV